MVRYKCMDCMWGPCTVIARAEASPPPRCIWAEKGEEDPPGVFELVVPKRRGEHDQVKP